jgi:hypothetical protein
MQQLDLVYSDIFAALRGLVSACGGSKAVGPMIWPAKGAKAETWLDDCLNNDRAAKLCLEEFLQLLQIGRERGWHAAKHFVDDATNYERSQPIEPVDELTRLLRAYMADNERQATRKDRIDSLIAKTQIKAVK